MDELPQPYRLIVGVLDTEIVDRAWAVIVERHPELATSPADEARVAADIDLGRSCPPSTRLQNPHPPLPLNGIDDESGSSTRLVITGESNQEEERPADGRVGNRAEDEESPTLTVANGNNNRDTRDGSDDHAAATPLVHEGGSSVTAVQWDRRGELMFTGGRDGSVCLRVNGKLEDMAVQIRGRGRGMLPEISVETGASAPVAFLSRPVGSLRVQSNRHSSVRIAAVLAPCAIGSNGGSPDDSKAEPGTEGEEKEGGVGDSLATPPPARLTHSVSILEVTSPIPGAGGEPESGRSTSGASATRRASRDPDADFNNWSSKSNSSTENRRPTARLICTVELEQEDAPTACTLSPDGRRLALTTAGGRVAIWVLPHFSLSSESRCPPSAARQSLKSGKHGEASPATAEEANGGAEGRDGDDVDGGASLDESKASVVGGDDDDPPDRPNAATLPSVAARVEAEAPMPTRLGKPEFSIPHLPSPDELAYAKALQEYSRRVKAGEILEPASASVAVEEEDDGTTPPPNPPKLSGDAHHLAHADFVPAAACDGGGGGGALSVWRSQSNVWRLYRLPPPVCGNDERQRRMGADNSSSESSDPTTGAGNSGGEDADQAGGDGESRSCALLEAKLDVSTLPSAEWILPSPITAVAVCEEGEQGEGCEWSCCGSANRSACIVPPLVAVGTENGGVYLCDGALSTAREGLSRHRGRVTALAFHGKRFVVSGSDDEMIQIHHVSVRAAAGGDAGGGGSRVVCCAGGTPRLRCLHYARGSGIVRVECLQEIPLMFAEDTSGRMVAYDLLSGTVLGVLALSGKFAASSTTAKPNRIDDGLGVGDAPFSDRALPQRNAGIVWACGGNSVVALLPTEQEEEERESVLDGVAGDGSGGALGVWSAADIMWGLSPGMRALAGGDRPLASRDITQLFYDLLPAQRKVTACRHPGTAFSSLLRGNDGNHSDPAATADSQYLPLPSPSPPSTGQKTNHFERRATPPPTTASSTKTSFHRSSVRQGITSWRDRPVLTKGNVDRLSAANGAGCTGVRALDGGARGSDGGVGEGSPWQSEMGAAVRVRRYMEGRHGDRAARQARLDNVTRNLLHAT
ncbi:unnamed protein product [Scytosiphon promiscuus]